LLALMDAPNNTGNGQPSSTGASFYLVADK